MLELPEEDEFTTLEELLLLDGELECVEDDVWLLDGVAEEVAEWWLLVSFVE